jgi:hypothetical protein
MDAGALLIHSDDDDTAGVETDAPDHRVCRAGAPAPAAGSPGLLCEMKKAAA